MFRSLFALTLALLLTLPAAAAPPNVVMIVGDDQGWTDYGFMGHEHVKTPHLDKLARESIVFKRGYVPSSLCRASLATMITGLYPHQHKITSNDPPLPKGLLAAQANKDAGYLKLREQMVATFEQSPNLPKLLAKEGYVSLQVGKWWEGNACRCGGFNEGMTHGDPAKGGRHGDEGLKIGRQGVQPVFDFVDKAKSEKKPFFVWYAPMMPHQPHNPPARLFDKYKNKTKSEFVAKYWAMCEWFDETVGEVLAKLEKSGLAENTIVIYLHDNGWIQDPAHPRYAPKSKQSPYEGGVRTPIMVRWIGKVAPGESQDLAHSIDLMPTILKALGVGLPEGLPGIDLLDPQATAARKMIFGECFTHNAINLDVPQENLRWRWAIRGTWKLIIPNPSIEKEGVLELYDLDADPTEERNLAKSNLQLVEDLGDEIDKWWPECSQSR